MEQQKAFIQQTYTHALVQAHARSRMLRARKHACINPLKPNFLKQSLLDENITHCYDWTIITILNLN